MPKLIPLILLVSLVSAQSQSFIHIDQFGYLPTATKVAVISDPQVGYNATESFQPGSTLELRSFESDQVVFSGSPTTWNGGSTHSQSGDRGWWFDFSSYTSAGTFYIFDPSTEESSAPFEINENPYHELLQTAFKAFYYNRCNASKESPYAATGWTDGMNFTNALQDANCRYVNDRSNAALEKDLTGGWFDAGDYNKYVTFAHTSVHDLLSTFEEHPEIFGDDWNLPESGNGLPDILDEIKWELDWLMKMSNDDGTAHIKMGSIDHGHNASAPPSANDDRRYYGPTCTAASIAISSMFAHAAKVYAGQNDMQSFASELEQRAIACYNVFIPAFNANALETNCDDGTIKAGDADRSEAEQLEIALIAAVYLFELTGESTYNDFFTAYYDDAETISAPFWGPYKIELIEALLLYTTLPNAEASVASDIVNAATTDVNNNFSGFFAFSEDDLYRAYAPDWMYHWGSNMPKAQVGNLCHMLIKYNVNPGSHADLLEKATEQLHYFHGVNPQGMVYLSNTYAIGGDRCANEIYHTWFNDGTDWDHAINSLYGPAPGFVVGGPNEDFSVSAIVPPGGQPPQKAYLDFNTGFPENSWEITEPAIYYQAAYIRFLANYVNDQAVTSQVDLLLATDCIELFPNPTSGIFQIRGILPKYKIEVFDNMGILVQAVDVLGSDANIDLSSLPAGTFFVRVENEQNANLCFQKILKQ